MMLFASWIKHPFNVPVQRPYDPDPCMHPVITALSCTDQAGDRGLRTLEARIPAKVIFWRVADTVLKRGRRG